MTVNEKFIINLQGKSFVTYEGLLGLAHQRNLLSMEVEIIQIPTPRQMETIKKLAGELNYQVNYDTLTKKAAGNIISRLIEEKKK